MNNDMIAVVEEMAAYREAKNDMKVARDELLRMSVDITGLTQKEAVNCDVIAYMDGWLMGNGISPSHRK